MPAILLDTHAAIWSVNGSINARAARIINAAAERGQLLLSPITAWEIGMLAARGRLKIKQPLQDYVRDLFAQPGVVVAELTPAVALEAALLPQTLTADPADRMLIATALAYGAQLVTRDNAIHEYANATKALRCLAC